MQPINDELCTLIAMPVYSTQFEKKNYNEIHLNRMDLTKMLKKIKKKEKEKENSKPNDEISDGYIYLKKIFKLLEEMTIMRKQQQQQIL